LPCDSLLSLLPACPWSASIFPPVGGPTLFPSFPTRRSSDLVVALDLEDDGPAVADVDRPRVLAGPLEHARPLGGEPGEVHARVLVGTVLRPEGREESQLGVGWLAAEAARDPVVFFGGEARGPREVERDLRWSPRQPGLPLE